MSELGDIADRASAREAELLQEALYQQRRRSAGTPGQASATDCVECGAAIPPARQQAVPGVQTCIECQAALEAAARLA